MEKIIEQLNEQTIESMITQAVEAITLESDNNDYEHGFKIYYSQEWEPLSIRYWKISLVPNKDKRYYTESVVSQDAFEKVLAWREDRSISVVTTERDYKVVFPKKPPVIMTDL